MKNLWCLVGRHAWTSRANDDGDRYVECRRCAEIKADDLPPDFGVTAIGPPGG